MATGSGHANTHRRTMQEQIFEALIEVLADKRYNDIGIGDICAKAYISRPTFYRYFANKDSLVRWKTKQLFELGLVQIGRTCGWEEGFYLTLVGFHRYKALYSDPQSAEFVSSFVDFTAGYQREQIVETILHWKGVPVTEKIRFEIEALSTAQSHMTRRWAHEGMVTPPETLAGYFVSIVPYDLYHLLNEPGRTVPDA